ncbi:integral membrane protein [Colletotrichum filicis]|nr:integral membrane protein [Colletotrichum filicis]
MLTIGFAKVSILCFYLETFSPNTWLNKATRITQGIIITTTVAITLLLYLSYLPSLSLNTITLFLATATLNIIMDVILLIFLIPVIFNLRMALNIKLFIAGIFNLGLLYVVIYYSFV